ncbi:MAG: hypothetical protein M3220_04065, partial [Chloroflexota bacterium]|nr:hypothetical protein [Chloroflexota bacterium]
MFTQKILGHPAARRVLSCTALLLLTAVVSAAQDPPPVGPDFPPPPVTECTRGRISNVFIDNHSVFDLSNPEQNQRFRWAFRLANRLHIRTREEVIERELLFREGGCYDPRLLEESERILRETGFIARADIYAVRQPDGTYHVVVDTQDDWSTRLEFQMEPGTGLRLSGVRLREDNFLGTGQQIAAFYWQSHGERVSGVSYLHPQLFGTRWRGGMEGGKTAVGHLFSASLIYPFRGETGRWAVRQYGRHYDRYFEFIAADNGRLFP